ncbi:MAG: phage tail protein [Oscillospiraceae bacterium]|nr:phage tail protein [Oscillospiraceae bacterium]
MYELYHEIGRHRGLLASLQDKAFVAWDFSLKTAVNDSGTLSLTALSSNPEVPYLSPLASELVVEKNGVEHWRGRLLAPRSVLQGTVQLTAKGCLDYLRDTIQEEQSLSCSAAEAFTLLISAHNGKPIAANKQFQLGIVDVTGTPKDFRISNGEKTWDVLKRLVKLYGGRIRLRRVDGKNIIDWTCGARPKCSQAITLGLNLLDCIKSSDVDRLATVIYPFGKVTEDATLTVTSVNDGKPYVCDTVAVAAFGWIEDSVRDSSIEDPVKLLEKGRADLESRLSSFHSVELTAIDLDDSHNTEAIEVDMDVDVNLMDKTLTLPCVAVERFFYDCKNTKITLGTSIRALSDMIGGLT